MSALTTFVCRSMDSSLRRTLSLFLTEVAPLTFCGMMNAKVRTELWDRLVDRIDVNEITCIYPDSSQESGFGILSNNGSKHYIDDSDGLIVGVRRNHENDVWERILGKSIPREYPLVRHLLDTSAIMEVLISEMFSEQQIATIESGFTFDGDFLGTAEDRRDLLIKFMVYAAGMHDIGKAVPHWQMRTLRLDDNHPSLSSTAGKQILYMPDKRSELADHAINSQLFFHTEQSIVPFSEDSHEGVTKALRHITAGHHGVFRSHSELTGFSGTYESYAKSDIGLKWTESQQRIEQCIMETAGIESKDLLSIHSVSQQSVILITGAVILADWMASTNSFIDDIDEVYAEYSQHYADSQTRAKALVSEHGLAKPKWRGGLSWGKIFPDFATPNPLQKSLVDKLEKSNHDKGIMLISAPMGSGKTEASLYAASMFAQRRSGSGFWINLPTKVTSDAMFLRATEIASQVFEGEEHSVALMHSDSAISTAIESSAIRPLNKTFYDGSTPDNISEHEQKDAGSGRETDIFISEYMLEKRVGGMASISVGTVDQALKSALPMKHNALRWLAMSGKTVILDEVHDYDPYTFSLIRKMVKWCGAFDIPVIAMSATLSGKSQRALLADYYESSTSRPKSLKKLVASVVPEQGLASPSWVYMPSNKEILESGEILGDDYTHYQTTVHKTSSFLSATDKLVRDGVSNNGAILCVCNTVKQAAALYDRLSHVSLGVEIDLLHARMPQEQRQAVVRRILDKTGKPNTQDLNTSRSPYILVTTQVVQQSMDIDFDVLITPLSPLPEILQRVGRVYRHEQGDRRAEFYRGSPQVHILVEDGIAGYRHASHQLPNLDASNASLVPYNHTMERDALNLSWGSLSALETLHRYLDFEYGVPISWDAKGSIHEVFGVYSELEQTALVGDGNPILRQALADGQDEILDKERSAEKVEISDPDEDEDTSWTINETTSTQTERSNSGLFTRIMPESFTVLPLWGSAEEGYFLDRDSSIPVPEAKGKRSIAGRRLVGLKAISVPANTFKAITEHGSIDLPDLLPDHIVAIRGSDVDKAGFSCGTVRGMVELDVNEGRYVWL